MESQDLNATNMGPSAPNDLPPPYSSVVGNPQYGFVVPPSESKPHVNTPPPKQFTAPGVYPHPPVVMSTQPQAGDAAVGPGGVAVGIVLPQQVGSEPTTITCFNCGKVVTTRVAHTTAWHTHLVAGSICIITM